jgi:hypothetical protein
VRSLAELDQLPVTQWTAEEGLAHLTHTFDLAARDHEALMEPYTILLGDAADDEERTRIMRRGLRETLDQRYPNPLVNKRAAA